MSLKLELYSIKDIKLGQFRDLTMYQNVAVATRDIENGIGNVPMHLVSDYQMWKLGEIDMTTGQITSSVEFITDLSVLKAAVDIRNANLNKGGEENVCEKNEQTQG